MIDLILFNVMQICTFVVQLTTTKSINMVSCLHDCFVANCDLFRIEKVLYVKN